MHPQHLPPRPPLKCLEVKASYYCNLVDCGLCGRFLEVKRLFQYGLLPTICLFFFVLFTDFSLLMHHLTMFVVFVTGIVFCMAGASYSNTCNCHCGHAYYGASPDDSSKAPYGSKANPGFSCKDINANSRKQNGIYWIRLTGMIHKLNIY